MKIATKKLDFGFYFSVIFVRCYSTINSCVEYTVLLFSYALRRKLLNHDKHSRINPKLGGSHLHLVLIYKN